MFLSLCLIAKDENKYLQEWLDYHILLGVEHFWIYDNESTVPLADSIQDYIKKGWVTINTIEGRGMQMFAYDHCIQTYGSDSKWIGFIDTDEFIVPNTPEQLTTVLKQYEPYGGLAISSLFFGDGGNKTRPVGGQISGYKIRTPERYSENRLVKLLIQPEKVVFPKDPHTFLFKDAFYAVNEKGKRVDAQRFPCHVDVIQLNHYFCRSSEEWEAKKTRWKGDDSVIPYSDDRRSWVNKFATVEDSRILDRLKMILPDSPKEAAAWSKIINRNSPHLINLLHQTVANFKAQPFKQPELIQIVPRAEFVDFHEETGLGVKYFKEGKLSEARELFANLIRLFPFDVRQYTNFAATCFQQGDFQAAWPALAQAWRIAPQSLEILTAMTDYYYNIGDYGHAESTSLLAASQGELEPFGVAILALSQWKQGKTQEAIATTQPILSILNESERQNPIFNELANILKNIA